MIKLIFSFELWIVINSKIAIYSCISPEKGNPSNDEQCAIYKLLKIKKNSIGKICICKSIIRIIKRLDLYKILLLDFCYPFLNWFQYKSQFIPKL